MNHRSRIFISSVQTEFSEERKALREYLRNDPVMQRCFDDVFLFEDLPASDNHPESLYLDEVKQSDVYVGLFGNNYGNEEAGISPTEREFDQATASGIHRLIFVKGRDDSGRHPKMQKLINKAQDELIRKRFDTSKELVEALDIALVEYLGSKDIIRSERFDAAPCLRASLDDLDSEQMDWFIRTAHHARSFPLAKGTSTEVLLGHLNLLNDGRPTNAAVLAFGKAPQQFLISSNVKCAHFHGTEVAKPIPSYQVYNGTAFQIVDQAVDFVLSKIALSVGTRAESTQAPVSYEIPKKVVREAIVNAVAHRDYTSNASVQVMLFSDRLEVLNPGKLPPGLTLEQLRETPRSVPNNLSLARSLYFTRYIEEIGSGIKGMISGCKNADLREPEFTIGGGFKVTIWRPTPPARPTSPAQIMVQPELLDEYLELVLSLLTNGLMSKSKLSKNLEHLESKIVDACRQYDKNYRERYGQVKVFSVGMRTPIPLDDIYVPVQLDQRMASQYKSPEEIEQAFQEKERQHFDSALDKPQKRQKRQKGTQVANNEQYLMLLGGPGAGKSTFLRKIGLEALKGKQGKCIPVFLELKRFTEDQIDIEALIGKEFEMCGYPDPEQLTNTALKSGKLLILFDGLDEVPAANVDNVISRIGAFVDQYSQNRFIASCRIAAYSGGFSRFNEVEMAAFDDIQIDAYIKKWFGLTPDQHQRQLDKEMKTTDQCWKTLNTSEHSATKELAKNPLLLTLLCMVYNRSQSFPRNRAALYEDALNIFLKEWAAEKRVNRGASITQYLDIADEKRMLSEIAKKNFDENRFFFTEDELIDQIQAFGARNANTRETFNAPKILETILVDQGLFVERVRGSYSFSHLTFQEYLTANYIVGDPRSIQDLVNQHLRDPQWREIFLLTAGLMRQADDLLVAIEAEAAKLINTDGIKSLLQWVKRKTDTKDDRYNRIVKRLFILRQFFSLWLLNKIYEAFGDVVNHALVRDIVRDLNGDRDFDIALVRDLDGDRDRDFDIALIRDLDEDIDFVRDIVRIVRDRDIALSPYFDLDIVRALARDFDLDLDLDLDIDLDIVRDRDFDLSLYLYQDFYKYIDADFYQSVPSQSRNLFDKQLQNQIALAKNMKELKIFKQVDLQQMVQRFNEQREFIKAAAERKSVEPPAESIHDTWLSVLGITDEMLAIPRKALKSYITTYLEAVELIVACKEAAGRVSPEVWQQIADRFLTVDAADIRN